MSDGNRDQLYLALRLATIEQQLDQLFPLILDDLLLNFDDNSAAAGFEALAEIAEKTQVIFFTHHRHLVELAKVTLEPSQWELQEARPRRKRRGRSGRIAGASRRCTFIHVSPRQLSPRGPGLTIGIAAGTHRTR